MDFIKKQKLFLILFAVCVVVALFSAWTYFGAEGEIDAPVNFEDAEAAPIVKEPIGESKINSNTTSLKIENNNAPAIPGEPQEISSTSASVFESATLIVGDKIFTEKIESGYTVYLFMDQLAKTEGLQFKAVNHAGLGYFVEEINGVKNDGRSGMYWIYYVNGSVADIGVSNYFIKEGDVITWKYEKPIL